MNCLTNYIGVKGFHTSPESGLFVNQLPGISLKAIQATANSEQVTFAVVFDDVQERAWRRLSGDFNRRMRAKYCLDKDTDTNSIICNDLPLFAEAWLNLLGAEIMFERIYSERINIYTTIKADKAEELRDLYTGLYENALDDLMPAIKWKEEDLELSVSYQRVERLP